MLFTFFVLYRCSSSEMAKGRCHIIGFKFNDPVFQGTYIALSAVGAAMLVLLFGALVVWRKKRRRQQRCDHAPRRVGAPPLGRFPGPGPADILDKRPWEWGPKMRYDDHAKAMSLAATREKLDNLEVAALVNKRLNELESGVLAISAAGGDKGCYGLPLNGCPTPPSPPKIPCPRHSPHSQRCGSLRRTMPHEPPYPHQHQHPPSVETDI